MLELQVSRYGLKTVEMKLDLDCSFNTRPPFRFMEACGT